MTGNYHSTVTEVLICFPESNGNFDVFIFLLGNWRRAYDVASRSLSPTDMTRLFNEEGQRLAGAKRYRDAEQLYLACGFLDAALTMYQSLKNYDAVIRLVAVHQPDQVSR